MRPSTPALRQHRKESFLPTAPSPCTSHCFCFWGGLGEIEWRGIHQALGGAKGSGLQNQPPASLNASPGTGGLKGRVGPG